MAESASSKIMVGGAKFQQAVLDWTKQSNHLYLTVLSAVIFMWAVYAEKLPEVWRWQLSTTIGRLLLLLLLYVVHMLAGWVPALLFAIAIGLTWANRPLYKPIAVKEQLEAFQSNIKVTDVETKKWFVEKVLKENPQRIIQDRVFTSAVQDDNASGSGRTSR
uniref:Uncharacterized protein n=1 Tax=viral metagenome TaxID=1070528 RepID=A0A6C0KLD6_9ZZZZ